MFSWLDQGRHQPDEAGNKMRQATCLTLQEECRKRHLAKMHPAMAEGVSQQHNALYVPTNSAALNSRYRHRLACVGSATRDGDLDRCAAGQQHSAQQGGQIPLQVVERCLGGRHPDNAGCRQVHDLEGLEGEAGVEGAGDRGEARHLGGGETPLDGGARGWGGGGGVGHHEPRDKDRADINDGQVCNRRARGRGKLGWRRR